MPPSKNKGKTRLGGKPSIKAKNRQIRKKKTTRNYPGRFNGAGTASGKATVWGEPSLENGTASVKAKNFQVDNKTSSSQKSKSHDDDDDDGGGTSRKEAQPGIWKQQPLDNFTPSELAELRRINAFRCTCRGSDNLSSCPTTRLPISPISFDDDVDHMFDFDTLSMYY